MFDRIISIDWSGRGAENERVSLRVATYESQTEQFQVQLPSTKRGVTRSWRRSECREYLRQVFSDKRRSIVACDFGFGLPWGADEAIFKVSGWRQTLRRMAEVYAEAGTARAAAQYLNSTERFNGHGPYRFNESRTDFRFYLDQQVAYYRLSELATPQAISQWYLGAGGTVGFHTITGMYALDWLISIREKGEINFSVWPFEPMGANDHVLIESYPSICPRCEDNIQCIGDDEKDAWRVLQMLASINRDEKWDHHFEIPVNRFGRIQAVDFTTQIQFEGWIFGLR